MNEGNGIELRVNDLFSNASESKINSFSKKTKSDLLVDLHFDKFEANFEWLDIM